MTKSYRSLTYVLKSFELLDINGTQTALNSNIRTNALQEAKQKSHIVDITREVCHIIDIIKRKFCQTNRKTRKTSN